MEIEIKKLTTENVDEFVELIAIFNDVFESDDITVPGEQYLADLLNKPDFLVLVARFGEMVIGGLTVYVLHSYYSAKPVAYIYDVGVRKDFQRNGAGIKLIESLKAYCEENGFDHAYVEAESDDQQAIAFYTKTKSDSSLHATHFTYELK